MKPEKSSGQVEVPQERNDPSNYTLWITNDYDYY
jgi:hypothetical protein